MSRTFRTKRPKMRLGAHLSHKLKKSGKVRDGTPTHASSSCKNHGGCPLCGGNRTHSNKRREPILGDI